MIAKKLTHSMDNRGPVTSSDISRVINNSSRKMNIKVAQQENYDQLILSFRLFCFNICNMTLQSHFNLSAILFLRNCEQSLMKKKICSFLKTLINEQTLVGFCVIIFDLTDIDHFTSFNITIYPDFDHGYEQKHTQHCKSIILVIVIVMTRQGFLKLFVIALFLENALFLEIVVSRKRNSQQSIVFFTQVNFS